MKSSNAAAAETVALLTLHRISKTSHLWLAITSTHVNRFWYFWQKCYQ